VSKWLSVSRIVDSLIVGTMAFVVGFFAIFVSFQKRDDRLGEVAHADNANVELIEVVDGESDPPISDDHPPSDVWPGQFSRSYLGPEELQFSCAVQCDAAEDYFGKRLSEGEHSLDTQVKAARALWKGRSRRYAKKVIEFASKPNTNPEALLPLQREVNESLEPKAILFDLQEGDNLWGTWLAFLSPHKDFVPVLLENLKRKPDQLPETMLALGASRDPRALQPLLELLASKDYKIAGDAANALGHLGLSEAEPKLIEALATDNGWRQVKAARALSRMGTARALPALEMVANDDRFTGALSTRSTAEYAVKCIKEREKL
jgi:hypothetical protein